MLLSPGDGQASAGRPGLRAKLADWRRDFRPWRKQRPFVGGVLVVLAGLEMLLSGPIKLDHIQLQFGVEGAQATILPLALVLLGIMSISQPVHRVFYGVIALAISVYTIAGVNLGGWIVGFLLGVIGGIVIVSWAPPAEGEETTDETADGSTAHEPAPAGGTEPADDAGPAGTEPAADTAPADGTAPADAAKPADDGEAPQGETPQAEAPGRHPERTSATEAIPKVEMMSNAVRAVSQKSAAVVLAGALALSGMGLPAAASASGAEATQDNSIGCVVFGVCEDDPGESDPSQSPSTPGTPSPGASEPATGDGSGDSGDGSGDATDPADGDQGAPADGGDASGDQADGKGGDKNGGDDKSRCKEPTQDGEVPPGYDTAPSDPCGEIDPQETIEKALGTELGTCVKVSFAGKYDINIDLPGQCGAEENGSTFSLPADLESRDLTIPLTGINGIGLANVPVKGNGERRDAIKISADKVVVDGFWLKSYAYDKGTVAGTDTRANFVSLEGDAHMYVSSIHANLPDGEDLLGIATQLLDGASLIEILLTSTDARMGFIGATSDVQVWDTFREQVWGDPEKPIGKGPTAGTP